MEKHWHTLSVAETAQRLESDVKRGLSQAEAARRLAEFGPNEISVGQKVSAWAILVEQFKNVLIIILLIATTVSFFLGHGVESIAIGIIVLFAVGLGFIQEFRAERGMEALQRMAAPRAVVIRDGESRSIPSREVVRGDLIILHAGDRIPADARITEAAHLRVEESALTGESTSVNKFTDAIANQTLAVADRKNLVYAGTSIANGRAAGLVIATAMETEFGQVARLYQSIQQGRTPLQENLDRVGKILARTALLIVALIVALGVVRGAELLDMFIFGVALAVAVVPEALPAVVTITLAIGVQRMLRRNALVRKLPAVETLGGVSYICSDKTGTLTRDEMTVRRIVIGAREYEVSGGGYSPEGEFTRDGARAHADPELIALLEAAALCNDAKLKSEDERWTVLGDPTEGALIVAAAKAGVDQVALDVRRPRIEEIPFTSESRKMHTTHAGDEGPLLEIVKGAPEAVLELCETFIESGVPRALDGALRTALLAAADRMAGEALRVLAVASRTFARLDDSRPAFTLLGLIGMMDPPRPEARDAVRRCEQAGIRAVMITGDHPTTAAAIARELGILRGGRSVTGVELDSMSAQDFSSAVEEIEVYARVSPEHKLRVVEALQGKSHVVAMTGDGVNDAPALRKADIGVAMGIKGTDVTREAADMTLTDDNFASIVDAVEEGRGIFANIKKYLMYLLSSNAGEIGLMAGASLLGLPLPLNAVQLLYVNLATDGLPALALAVDPLTGDAMSKKPRNPRRGIFTRSVTLLILAGGLWSTLVNVSLFSWALASGKSASEAMSLTFISLVLIQFFKAYSYRSDVQSVFVRPFSNRWLNLAIVWELILLVCIIYTPFLKPAFATYDLPLADWLIAGGLAFTIVPAIEIAKRAIRRFLPDEPAASGAPDAGPVGPDKRAA